MRGLLAALRPDAKETVVHGVRETLERRVLPVLLAVLSGISLAAVVVEGSVGSDSLLARFTDEIDGVGPAFLVAVAALAVFYTRFWDGYRESSGPVTHVLAALFAAFTLVGMSYEALDSWDVILGRKKDLAFALVVFAGYFVLFDFCLAWLYRWLDARGDALARAAAPAGGTAPAPASSAGSQTGEAVAAAVPAARRFPEWIERHYTLFCFLVICLCWLPFWIPNLPGSVPYDGYYQLNMGMDVDNPAMGVSGINNHHPWVLSMAYGLVFRVGRVVSDNFGVFLIVALSFLLEAVCYATVCSKIRKWVPGRAANVCALLFFAVVPVFGAFAQDVFKDSIYTALVALFFALYVDLCVSWRRGERVARPLPTFALLFVVELAVCLTRNNGVYLVVPADVLLLLFLMGRQKAWALVLTLLVGLSYWCVENPVADAVGVEPGSVKEALSIPFQQTARYVSEYPDEVTEEEREAIDAVLEYDELAEVYDPETVDPVKRTYHAETTEEVMDYLTEAWLPMMLRHPAVYLQALLNDSYGYWYPFSFSETKSVYHFYIQGEPVATGEFDIHYLFGEGVRNKVSAYAEAWVHIPGLAQLVNPGTYAWVLIAMGGYLCRRKRYRDLLVLAAPALSLAVCIASPVNGYVRYALPLMACAPVIVAWCAGRFGPDAAADMRGVPSGGRHFADAPSADPAGGGQIAQPLPTGQEGASAQR